MRIFACFVFLSFYQRYVFFALTSRSLMKTTQHLTFGMGLARDEFSVDIGFDYSKRYQRLLITTHVYP